MLFHANKHCNQPAGLPQAARKDTRRSGTTGERLRKESWRLRFFPRVLVVVSLSEGVAFAPRGFQIENEVFHIEPKLA